MFAADGTQALLCQWHVLNAVSKQLVLKVRGAAAQADGNAILADFTKVLHLNLGASAARHETDAAVRQAFQIFSAVCYAVSATPLWFGR